MYNTLRNACVMPGRKEGRKEGLLCSGSGCLRRRRLLCCQFRRCCLSPNESSESREVVAQLPVFCNHLAIIIMTTLCQAWKGVIRHGCALFNNQERHESQGLIYGDLSYYALMKSPWGLGVICCGKHEGFMICECY